MSTLNKGVSNTGALEGIKILDMTNWYAGPFCTLLMRDLGAEIIKIEPLEGERIRTAPPMIGGESYGFMQLNRNKKSLRLNLYLL